MAQIGVLCSMLGILCRDTCITDTFDYIVVGVGSAGSAITGRLSEDPNSRILALEAGKEAEDFAKIPFFSKFTLISHMTWGFFTAKQESCCKLYVNQKVSYVQGKALGGGSSINDLQYTRGCRRDYENWAEQGNDGWNYTDVLPYFLKLEDYKVPHSPYDAKFHSRGGPVSAESGKSLTPMSDAFLEAAFEMGYPKVDLNGEYIMGFSKPVQNLRNGARLSSYDAYVKPALGRQNLRVETAAQVTKILFDDNKRAIGVEYLKGGRLCNVSAKKEVIISAGSINTPKLLLLSGIGSAVTLRKHNIPLVHELPGVGQNFQDHVVLLFPVSINQSLTYRTRFTPQNVLLWKKSRTGPMTNAFGIEGMGYFSSGVNNHPEDWPDLELFFVNDDAKEMVLLPYFEKLAALALTSLDPYVMTMTVILQRPKSRGNVTLLSSKVEDPPVINPAYLTHEDDVRALAKGVEKLYEFINTQAFRQYGARIADRLSPHCDIKHMSREEYYTCLVHAVSTAGFHASGTSKMGPKTDPMAVVDNRLRVHGLKGLRVADSSIMPDVLVTHINIPCMMIGEKAADMIKEDNK